MGLLTKIWGVWLAWPIGKINQYLGIDLTTGWRSVAFKVAVIIVAAVIVFELLGRAKKQILKFLGKDDFLEVEDMVLPAGKDQTQGFSQAIEGARNLEKTIAPLKKAKQYDRVAEVYASLNKHKDAAKWFAKARDRKRAAMEWALAGHTAKAAKLLMKEGDFATAARFFEEIGDHRRAGAAHEKLGNLPKAAAAYAKAKRLPQAVKMFQDYFAGTQDPFDTQLQAADACYAVLQSDSGRTPIDAEARRSLTTAIADRYVHAKRYDVASALFREAGQLARAGEVYVLMGKLPEAAACMREAGKTKEATLIGARYYELHEKWAEAGMAYAGGEEFRKAGDCFAKANMAARAAECYERAGEFYGAALAYSHLGSYDKAIHLLQRIKETEKTFDQSRALLGRCFYEMHDYAHCAATLENHLLGKRVESANVDYFYMLALAYEQLDKLEKSQEVLYKIRSVNVEYKDVTARLSNISSRISIRASAGPGLQTPVTPGAPGPARTQIMEMVENLLGGRYELKSEIGRGGMGVVYLAHDAQLDRPVALKFLGTLVDDSEEYRQRFTREAKTAARVNHPNIVSIYDISAAMGRAYIAMEYIDGKSLTRYLRDKTKLSARETVNVAMQACSALDAVHKAGIIHRDIKPDNILLTKGGLVKLTDFGLAKAENARMTASHVVMGTPAYMSPEQTRGSDVDARSDVYAMGLVMYEMLTGTAPFTGPDALRRQQEETPERPAMVVAGVPETLDQIVMKCIDKDPESRFQTAGDLLAALRQTKE